MKTSKKRCISLALAVLMVTVLFAGCGGKGGNAGGKTGDSVTEKLQSAKNYELTLFNSSEGVELSCTVQVDAENQTFYVVDESDPLQRVNTPPSTVRETRSTDGMPTVTLCAPISSVFPKKTLMASLVCRSTAYPDFRA